MWWMQDLEWLFLQSHQGLSLFPSGNPYIVGMKLIHSGIHCGKNESSHARVSNLYPGWKCYMHVSHIVLLDLA